MSWREFVVMMTWCVLVGVVLTALPLVAFLVACAALGYLGEVVYHRNDPPTPSPEQVDR